MSEELRRRPNDTIAWAQLLLPKLQAVLDRVFTIIEWTIVIGFIKFLGEKFDDDLLRLLHAVLTGAMLIYSTVLAWSLVPRVAFGKTPPRILGIQHLIALATAISITCLLTFVANRLGTLAAQAN